MKKKNILIVSAHSDDHIMCAGTVLKLKQKGYIPFEIILTNSALGGDQRKDKSGSIKDIRQKEYEKAAKYLGIKKFYNLEQPDLGLEYSNRLMLEMAKIIGEIKPDIAFIPPALDWHIDHKVAHQISKEAIKWANTGVGGNHKVSIILCYEGTSTSNPDVLVDITSVYEQKNKLMSIYESQYKSMKQGEYLSAVRGYQLRRGPDIKAESFTTIPGELPSLLFEHL